MTKKHSFTSVMTALEIYHYLSCVLEVSLGSFGFRLLKLPMFLVL